MNFLELAEKVIQTVNQPLTANEIWEKSVELGLDQQLNKRGKTPWATLGARLYISLRDDHASPFQAIGKRPIRFGLKNVKYQLNETTNDSTDIPNVSASEKYSERDLHPLFVKFADAHFHFRGAKFKTIFHEISLKNKRGLNKWIHPDIVGIYFSFNDKLNDYEKVIIDFQKDFTITSFRLFSFEVKIRLTASNLRECYFQAVSNSSWANEGYLVALKIDDDVVEEARRLANSFGIGLIHIDAENSEDGEIVVPARFKKELDIDAMDRLANKNKDFASFLQNIMDDNKIGKINSKYDHVLDDIAYRKYLKEKWIL